ncbi:MAG: hypothetical protein KAI43_04965 [Candidatus Aureabacteria bacterium]|nr:hypothetical protein [Candidatus Auribacterota bacterium]
MAIDGISRQEQNLQAFQALSTKEAEGPDQSKKNSPGKLDKLNSSKDEDAKKIFQLSVEKEQGKGINVNLIG